MSSASGGGTPDGTDRSTDGFPVVEGYDIIDQVGRGGMGVVYEAFQRSTGRRVAVKLMLDRVAASEAARRRFEREVELIARLQHPNIVGILDSGLSSGRYFYVMDFVEGVSLDERLAPGACEVRESLRVMAKVARAVDYAHQRGVMHRDLKPGNIVVDERGEPRLLDFGLAKAFDPNSMVAVRDSLSEPGQVIGTLGYMSPEQARGAAGEVSVRSDVYALGAIAYELVAGRLPCALDGAMALVFQRIESRDPDVPSALRPGVSRDVDAVLLRALEKDPQKRYPTALALAEDLERYLGDAPVTARRAGVVERAGRWCRRNPAWAGLGVSLATVVLVLAASAWWTSVLARRGEQAEKIQRNVDATLGQAMLQLDPDQNPGMAAAAALTLAQVEAGLLSAPRPPAEEAVWRERIGEQQRKIGQYANAQRNARRVVELRGELTSGDDWAMARALRNLGASLFDLRRFMEAEQPYRRSLEMRLRLARGKDHEDVADGMNHLAACLARAGEFEEAERLQRSAVEMRVRLHGENDERSAAAVNNLATIVMAKGDAVQGEALYRSAMATFRALRGEKHRYVGRSLRNIAACVLAQGRVVEADALLERSLAVTSEVLGPGTPDAAGVLHDMAGLRMEQGRPQDAERLARQSLEVRLDRLGPGHQDTADARLMVGRALLGQGRPTEAEESLRDAMHAREEADPPMPAEVAEARLALGTAAAALGRAEESWPLLRQGLEGLSGGRAKGDVRSRRLVDEMVRNLEKCTPSEAVDTALALMRPGSKLDTGDAKEASGGGVP